LIFAESINILAKERRIPLQEINISQNSPKYIPTPIFKNIFSPILLVHPDQDPHSFEKAGSEIAKR